MQSIQRCTIYESKVRNLINCGRTCKKLAEIAKVIDSNTKYELRSDRTENGPILNTELIKVNSYGATLHHSLEYLKKGDLSLRRLRPSWPYLSGAKPPSAYR